MSEVEVDLFVEDRAHEEFLRALVIRIAQEEGRTIRVQPRSVRGGHGRALSELSCYLRLIEGNAMSYPDILVVCIDTNCKRFTEARDEVAKLVEQVAFARTVIACPNPHVERWYLADPEAFKRVVGKRPSLGQRKCERGYYKNKLTRLVRDAGHLPTLGGIEFASEIVDKMDFYRAGKNERSLKLFIEDFRSAIRTV